MESWFKVERNILENGIINRDTQYLAVWIYLLSHAAYKPLQMVFNGNPIELEKGQLVTSRKKIAEKLGIDESKVQRVLTMFENAHLIEQQNCIKGRLITVFERPLAEKSEQENELSANRYRTVGEPSANTNNKYNNYNKYTRNKYPRKMQSDYEEPAYDLEEFARRSIHLKYEKKSDKQ